jgi:hypothetical protein
MDLPLSNSRNAYVLAGFPGASTSTASRKLTFTQNGTNDVFLAATVAPSLANPLNGIQRNDQVKVDPTASGAFQSSAVPNLVAPGTAGYYAFGSFLSPRYQYASASGHVDNPYGVGNGFTDGEIPPVPTTKTPAPFGADRLGAIVVTPNPSVFPAPWPVAIYGPGFTRSDYDLFVTADYNASLGILTVATDPSGHGFGPLSTTTVTSSGAPTTFLSYGRGRDLDGDGLIGDGLNDGVGPTGHFQPGGSELPTRKPIDGLESGLVQTTVDDMALGRAVAAGLDIPGVGTNLINPAKIMYYGLSFGGIYGTMHGSALPPGAAQRSRWADRGHRAAVVVPRRSCRDTGTVPAEPAQRRPRSQWIHRGSSVAQRPGGGHHAPGGGRAAGAVRRFELVRPHRQPGDVRTADPVAA